MTQYINKDAVVAEIERRQKEEVSYCENGSFASWADENHYSTLEAIKSFIDTLEVKEVDLDSNIRAYLTNHFNVYEDGVLQSKKSSQPLSTYDIIKVAEHFFELGIKVNQKGE